MKELRLYRCDHPTGPHMVGCISRPVDANDIAAALTVPLLAKRVEFHGPLPANGLSDVEELARDVVAELGRLA